MNYDLQCRLSIEERCLLPDSLFINRQHLKAAIALRDAAAIGGRDEQAIEMQGKIDELKSSLDEAGEVIHALITRGEGAIPEARKWLKEKV